MVRKYEYHKIIRARINLLLSSRAIVRFMLINIYQRNTIYC